MNPKSLANLRPAKKGEVRNPKGRPTKDKTISSLLGEMLDKQADIMLAGEKTKKTWRQLVVEALLRGAARGNPPLIKEVFDRTEGKVSQPLTGEGGQPIILQFVPAKTNDRG